MIRLGIVGCGTIGSELCHAVQRGKIKARISAIADINRERAEQLARSLQPQPLILPLPELVKNVELIIEAATQTIVREILEQCIRNNKDLMVMSVGGLLQCHDLLQGLDQTRTNLYAPSGAIAGVDALLAAAGSEIHEVTLTTTKPPKGLANAPYVQQKKIMLAAIREKTVIFEGSAAEAVKGFPQNTNVAATLSLAGIGPERTKVKVVVDPQTTQNSHEVTIRGSFGTITTKTENLPSPTNPKTSYLAVLSALATVQRIISKQKIGT
ncbi:aspartate dehydrogenase [Candidatus Woesearchaeota archaeon]|nr:aspartate dehydrogenase [Candidatus Woesearchaeota archaeon]